MYGAALFCLWLSADKYVSKRWIIERISTQLGNLTMLTSLMRYVSQFHEHACLYLKLLICVRDEECCDGVVNQWTTAC